MGRILDVLRRKISQPSISPKSSELCNGWSDAVQSNQSRVDVVDKENAKPILSIPFAKESLMPLFVGNVHHDTVSENVGEFDESVRENNINIVHVRTHQSGENYDVGGHSLSHYVHVDVSTDEFTESSDEGVLASISESEHSSEAAAASVSEVTEVSDDGVLRDDEGNPIDLYEAEENMLRDDEGNIIDPKTLVLRDTFVDISPDSECDFYNAMIDSTPLTAAGSVPIDAEVNKFMSTGPELVISHGRECVPRKNSPSLSSIPTYDDAKSCKRSDLPDQPCAPLRRRKRRELGAYSGHDECVHILFHNKLSTLVEESWPLKEFADNEKEVLANSSTCSVFSSASSDEDFIRARWDYYLHVKHTGSCASHVIIDAMDEINNIIRPKISCDDCSVEIETGEI